jgi:hypothetical protein
MPLKTEKYSAGKFFVYTKGDYPRRVGHVVGARSSWHAEAGAVDLGYHKTKKAAVQAIASEVGATESNPDIDLDKAGIEEMYDAVPRGGRAPALWHFQFGPYTGTNVFVWGGHLEDGLETAASWLKENAPGHFYSNADIMDFVRDVLKDQGKTEYDYMRALEEHDQWAYDVEEEATADLTYTESGYLASHEWYVNELHEGDELYAEVWEATIEVLIDDDDLSDGDREDVNEFAAKLGFDYEFFHDDDYE